jgi:hypothetical protein
LNTSTVLTPWYCNNPRSKDSDELCDVLVVCDPQVIIVSAKAIEKKDSQPTLGSFPRWQANTIDGLTQQI